MWVTEYQDETNSTSMKGLSINPGVDFIRYLLEDFQKDFEHHGGIISKNYIDGLNLTNFETRKLNQIFNSHKLMPPAWEWGEIFATSQIEKLMHVRIPWPVIRDKRAKNASLPGPDIVGLLTRNGNVFFAFGEVKTSSEENLPPSVVTHSRTGLISQIKHLAYGNVIEPIKWLLYKVENQEWAPDFWKALEIWLKNQESIFVMGLLVRDTVPTKKDLHRAFEEFKDNTGSEIRFFAFYLPISIGECIKVTCSEGGGTTVS